jgi:hypothetical protein
MIVAAGVVAALAVYVGFKAYHQMHTPLAVYVVERNR